ncbi:MAG: bifunctional acetaldehyde-CoA/alcohol dehydrogenase, partial [Alkalispirochaetaceae bacterium]
MSDTRQQSADRARVRKNQSTQGEPQALSGAEICDAVVKRVAAAQERYATYTQEQVDRIFAKASMAANLARIPLAQMAREETGMGVLEDKVIKNHFAAEYVYNTYKDTQTCGEIERDETNGITKILEPVGVIAGVIPTTNPTSTAIFKALLALKT